MAKKGSAPQTTSQTTRQEIDPAIRGQLVGNLNLANVLTSGMLPRQGGTAGGTSTSAFGNITFNPDGTPNYGTTSPGGEINGNPDPSQFLNPDGTQFTPPTTFTAGFDPTEIDAQNRAINLAGTGLTAGQLGGDVADRLKNFNWEAMRSPTTYASQVGAVSPMQAAQIAAARDISARQFTDLDFDKYMMPGREQVIDPIKSYFDESAARGVSAGIGAGRVGGAVRGSNEALRESLIRGEVGREGGQAISGALQNLYGISAGLATGDLDRSFRADASNQNADLTRNLAQGQLDQQAAERNYLGELQRGITNAAFRQSTDQFDAGNIMRANEINNDNQFRAPLIQAQGAQMGANALLQSRGIDTQNIGLLQGIGADRRGLTQARMDDPWRALALRSGMLEGALPSFTGSTMTGTATGGNRGGGLAGALGGAAGGLGLYGALTSGASPLLAASGPLGWGAMGLGALAGLL